MSFKKMLVIAAAPFVFAFGAHALEVGDHAPCVVLNNIAPDGSENEHCIRNTNVDGQMKIIEFFSATCSDCQKNLPVLTALAERVNVQATTRVVGLDRDEKVIREYIAQNKAFFTFEVALDTSREATKAYGVTVVPSLFVLDANNTVVYRHNDSLTDADVEEIVKLVGGK